MAPGEPRSHGIEITPLYVLEKLEEHTRECSKRWWSVMMFVITNLVLMVGGMASIIVMLMRAHP